MDNIINLDEARGYCSSEHHLCDLVLNRLQLVLNLVDDARDYGDFMAQLVDLRDELALAKEDATLLLALILRHNTATKS